MVNGLVKRIMNMTVIAFFCTVLHCTVLYWTVLCSNVIHAMPCHEVMQCIAIWHNVV